MTTREAELEAQLAVEREKIAKLDAALAQCKASRERRPENIPRCSPKVYWVNGLPLGLSLVETEEDVDVRRQALKDYEF